MRRWWRFAPTLLLMLSAPAVLPPPAPTCAEAPCRLCFVIAGAVDRAGGEPISCAAA